MMNHHLIKPGSADRLGIRKDHGDATTWNVSLTARTASATSGSTVPRQKRSDRNAV